MTLPVSGPLSLTDVMTELRVANPARAYPITLGDADVRALAGGLSGAISIASLYGKSSYTPMNVSGTGDTGFALSNGGAGTVSCTPSVSVSNGLAPYTYLWSFTSNPSGCTLSNSTSSTCTVSKGYGFNTIGSASAVLQCQVSDAFPNTVTAVNVSAELSWANGA